MALIGERYRNYQQLRVQLRIARLRTLDQARARRSLKGQATIHDLAAAALILTDSISTIFREGELSINNNNVMCMAAQELA